MATRIFCGNLAYELSSRELREFFEGRGYKVVNAEVVCDKRERSSRGFGFVELSENAEKAVEELNGETVAERRLRLELAHSAGKR
jgi:RNA recognition motif-containing protein